MEVDPSVERGFRDIAKLYISIIEDKEKLALCKDEKGISLNCAEVYFNLGNSYFIIGKFKDAILMLNKAISFNPDLAVAQANLAQAYYYEKQFNSAREHADMAVKLGYQFSTSFLESIKAYKK